MQLYARNECANFQQIKQRLHFNKQIWFLQNNEKK